VLRPERTLSPTPTIRGDSGWTSWASLLERGEHVRLGGRSWRTRDTDPSAFSDEA
jgi:hypothetical protein